MRTRFQNTDAGELTYESLKRMTLNDAHATARLASMEDRGDENNGHSAGSDESRDEPAHDIVWDSLDLQGGDHQDVPALQVI